MDDVIIFHISAIDLCQTDNGGCEENSSCIYEGPGMVQWRVVIVVQQLLYLIFRLPVNVWRDMKTHHSVVHPSIHVKTARLTALLWLIVLT